MIYVNQKQLEQVEYIIEQSAKGHHVLFENDVIRKAFDKHTLAENNTELDEATEKHIENIILQPTLVAKKAYLENLSPSIFWRVVRSYFSIIENNIIESNKYTQ